MASVDALQRLLDELAAALGELTAEVYTARPMAPVSGSIGEHVRHALDHVAALVHAGYPAVLTYDHRERGTVVETDVDSAIGHAFRLKSALDQFARRDLDEPVQVTSKVSPDHSVTGWSTLTRELAFVVSHTIHHQAMIAVLLACHGHAVSGTFGFAPATLRR
jgi:uncharacterized damage-inducible protein DinB